MWLAIVGTVAAVTVVFHWYVTRPARQTPRVTATPPGPRIAQIIVDQNSYGDQLRSPTDANNCAESVSSDGDLYDTPPSERSSAMAAANEFLSMASDSDQINNSEFEMKTCCSNELPSATSDDCGNSCHSKDNIDTHLPKASRKAAKQQDELPIAYSSVIDARRALIVIAHPDDECMFYAPTIMGLLRRGTDIHLLCLSSGNYRRKGLQRKVELRHSCATLGIPPSNITVVEHTKLPDDPHLLWNKGVIKDILLKYVEKLSIDVVITFDDYGVSGHINHIALFKACQHMYSKGMFPVGTQVFVLQSVNLVRKYLGMVDTLFSHMDGATHLFTSGYWDIFRAQRAMFKYRSQLVWFRLLYILFSRYMIVNTLRRIAMEERYYKYGKNSSKDDWEGSGNVQGSLGVRGEAEYSNPVRQRGLPEGGESRPAPVRRKLSH